MFGLIWTFGLRREEFELVVLQSGPPPVFTARYEEQDGGSLPAWLWRILLLSLVFSACLSDVLEVEVRGRGRVPPVRARQNSREETVAWAAQLLHYLDILHHESLHIFLIFHDRPFYNYSI